jgi:hypothetical protein
VSGLRAPVVAGVAGGVGTTTVAVALRGHDGACERVDTADVLACRGTLDSLARAAAALEHAGPGPRPVLAVTLDGARARGALRARLELLDAGAIVVLPHVRRWRTLADPVAEAAILLREPVDRLPRPLRAYAAALRELAGAVATSGRLHRPSATAPPILAARPFVGARPFVDSRLPRAAVAPLPEVRLPVPVGPRGVRIVLPGEQAG